MRDQRADGLFFPLATDYSGRGIAAMNALYYQWASFIDFLISTFGRDEVRQAQCQRPERARLGRLRRRLWQGP